MMRQKRFLRLAALILSFVVFFPSNAYAYWWFVTGNVGRAAVTTGARSAAVGAATASGAAHAGRTASAEAAAARAGTAVRTSPSLVSGSGSLANRYCVRPLHGRLCDWRVEKSAFDAASSAVGPNYRVERTKRPNVFDVINAAGTLVDVIQAVDALTDPSVRNHVQVESATGSPHARMLYSGYVSRMAVIAEIVFDDENGVRGYWTVTNDPKLAGQRFPLEGNRIGNKIVLKEYEGLRHSLDVYLDTDLNLSYLRGRAFNTPPRPEVWDVMLTRH
jgi:hypothetical protein